MEALSLFRQLVQEGRVLLEATVADVTPEQVRWNPPGTALPIGAQYAHVVLSQDMGLHGLLKGMPPLAATTWVGKTGMSALPPPFGQPWTQWARQATFDLPALRQYAQAVYQASDDFFASLADADLGRPLDLSSAGFGPQTVAFVLTNGWINNVNQHCGEIACLKGLQGGTGYGLIGRAA